MRSNTLSTGCRTRQMPRQHDDAGGLAGARADGPPPRPLDRRPIAYHEGGHAVAAWTFELPIDYVSIVPDERSAGRLQHGPIQQPTAAAAIQAVSHAHLIVLYAGAAAQRRFAPRSNVADGSNHDYGVAGLTALGSCRDPAAGHALIRWARAEAKALIAERWAAVTAVADALMKREVISGEETVAICAAADAPCAATRAQVRAEVTAEFASMSPDEQDASIREHQTARKRARPVTSAILGAAVLRTYTLHRALLGNRPIRPADFFEYVAGDLISRGFDGAKVDARLQALIARQERKTAATW
jgi:hypothetical protein